MENSRKYVGQRYVPKIMGEWNKTFSYEGLSIVTNEGNSYTSKKRVPIGIDISNEDYWVVTGNYNAQIENYREDVKQNNEELKTYQQDTNRQLIQTNGVNVLYPPEPFIAAKGDGVTDDANALQEIITNFKEVYIPEGEYIISKPLNIPINSKIIGAGVGKTKIITTNTANDAFVFAQSSYRNELAHMHITSRDGIGLSNAGLKFTDINGGQEMNLHDLVIVDFHYGIKAKDSFWQNTMKRIRIYTCNYGFYMDGTVGSSIVLNFDQVYFDRSLIGGCYITAGKSIKFNNCNFGGRKGFDDKPTFALSLGTNTIGASMEATNIEHHVANASGIIRLTSGSTLTIDGVSAFDIKGLTTEQAFFIATRDTSRLTVLNCPSINVDSNVMGVYHINDSQLTVINSDVFFNKIQTYSSFKPVILNDKITANDVTNILETKFKKGGGTLVYSSDTELKITVTVTGLTSAYNAFLSLLNTSPQDVIAKTRLLTYEINDNVLTIAAKGTNFVSSDTLYVRYLCLN